MDILFKSYHKEVNIFQVSFLSIKINWNMNILVFLGWAYKSSHGVHGLTIYKSLVSTKAVSKLDWMTDYCIKGNHMSNINDLSVLDMVLYTLLLNYISQNLILC